MDSFWSSQAESGGEGAELIIFGSANRQNKEYDHAEIIRREGVERALLGGIRGVANLFGRSGNSSVAALMRFPALRDVSSLLLTRSAGGNPTKDHDNRRGATKTVSTERVFWH
jgi:hypothetical protein